MRYYKTVLWLCLIFGAGLCTVQAAAVDVQGKVTVEGAGASGVVVKAYSLAVNDFAGTANFASAPSDENGHFELSLDAGQYYFIAEGGELFTYYGRNPVTVTRDGIDGMNLALVKRKANLPGMEPLISEGVAGRLDFAGKPLSGAVVSVYTDLSSQLKGMGFGMSIPTDESGYFEIALPPGTYYLVARKRGNGQISGPLGAGDYFGYSAENPLVVKAGAIEKVGINLVEVPQKVERLADSMFGKTSIHGKILNAVGSPVAGVRALLYIDSSMLNRPLYVSQPSAADGSYVLSFPKGGTYFLAARDKLGGAPGPGELYGRYPGSQDSSVRIRTGQQLEGVDLLVQEMW